MSREEHRQTSDASPASPVMLGVIDPLAEAAARLLDREPDPLGEIDLSMVVVVTPGRRAGRQLLVALDDAAAAQGRRFVAPTFTTLAALDESLVIPAAASTTANATLAVADDATVLAAIGRAIVDAATAEDAVPEGPLRWLPRHADPLEVHALARRLFDADRTVRAGDRTWTDVAAAAERRAGDGERYRGIAAVMAETDRLLAAHGLQRRDHAIEAFIRMLETSHASAGGHREIVLVGVVDLGPRDARLLRAAASCGLDVRPFIIAADDRASAFDEFGAVRPDVWMASPPIVPVDGIRVEARPTDVALSLADWLADRQTEAGGALDPEDIAIVLADESMGEVVRRELQACGAAVHLGQGRSPISDGPARTLERLADWHEHPDSLTFGGLLADPAIEAALRASSDIDDALADWTGWAADQMPRPIESEWMSVPEDAPESVRSRSERLSVIDASLGGLLGGGADDVAVALPVQIGAVIDLLARIDLAAGDASPWSESALRAVRTAGERLSAMPTPLAPIVGRAHAIRLLLDVLQGVPQPDPGSTDAIETIGWLEAPFDPAPRLAVVGLHDAAVPGSSEDPLLPESLRAELGLEDAARRTARDAWVLATMLGRDPAMPILLPREDGGGERLVPSRLLFGDRGVALADRVSRLFREVPPRSGVAASVTSFARFRPSDGIGGIQRPAMSVTEFRLFLQSPYRYWLRYGLGLKADPPAGRELDARHFGTVLHAAVEAFGNHELARLAAGRGPLFEADAIHDEMMAGMNAALAGVARGPASAGLRLQTRILERRLRRVAEIQAERANAGWRIHAVEWEIDCELDVPGESSQRVKGRIDRIDRHDEFGWLLLDFKTSDSGKKPDPAHRRSDGTWLDLQLPLYRWAAAQSAGAPSVDEIRSGYFVVGGRLDGIGIQLSEKIDPLQDEAIDTAAEVVHSVRAGYFDDLGVGRMYPEDPAALLMRVAAVGADADEEDA